MSVNPWNPVVSQLGADDGAKRESSIWLAANFVKAQHADRISAHDRHRVSWPQPLPHAGLPGWKDDFSRAIAAADVD